MMNKKIQSLYSLKYNPFTTEVPTEALYTHTKLEYFCWRIEQSLVREGGFALVSGDPGTGKSVALRVLSSRLQQIRDIHIGIIQHSTGRLSDFYRELGDIFGVSLSNTNRFSGFKGLRERWLSHLKSTFLRPVLFLDEAQQTNTEVLSELRLLSSMQFDSQILLSVILAGDQRLNDRLGRDELLPLGSRIRVRYQTEYASREQLLEVLTHLTESAGNPGLMTAELMKTLAEHAAGNYRILCTMANELLEAATMQERTTLDEQLFFECFAQPKSPNKRKQ